MSMYLNSSTNSNLTIRSSSNSENFNSLRSNCSKKGSSSLQLRNNGCTPSDGNINGKTTKTTKTTKRVVLGDISNFKKKDSNRNNSSSKSGDKNARTTKKALSSSFNKPSFTFIPNTTSSNFAGGEFSFNSNISLSQNKKKGVKTTKKKHGTENETSIFVDDDKIDDFHRSVINSKANQGGIISLKKQHDSDCDSIERPAGLMWHEQHLSDEDDDFPFDIKEIKNDIKQINAQVMFGVHENVDFEEVEAQLNLKIEEALFSHDPYEGKFFI